jgi:diacylglycerol kinase family enzyme
MTEKNNLKRFFIVNAGSGNNTTDWPAVITDYFKPLLHTIELYILSKNSSVKTIKEKIKVFSPHQVIAVGGDGTIKLAAECILGTKIALGILPAGSANGLAKELGISDKPTSALDVLVKGHSKKIHVTTINGELCIHLSDIGLNAYAMKKFESLPVRGMWGYLMASIKVLWQNPQMEVEMKIDNKSIKVNASMIVIANATSYGTGAVINPIGQLDDEVFEVIAIKKISPREIFKMVFTQEPYDSEKIEIFQTDALLIHSRKKVHFQIDGEYLGKVREVKAILIPDALEVIVAEPVA